MISRAPVRPRPIPFLDPLQQAEAGIVAPLGGSHPAPNPTPIPADRIIDPRDTARTRAPAPCPVPALPAAATTTDPGRHLPQPQPRARREVLVRHDGEHPVSVRSAATGHHYRFEACGGTQWVDAADIALLRRIEHMHIG